MEGVVNLDNVRLLDNYNKIIDERRRNVEDTITEIRTLVRRKAVTSVKATADVFGLIKDLFPIRYTNPDIYEQEKNILVSLVCTSLNIKETPQSKIDLLNEFLKIEDILTPEINPILGIDEKEQSIIEAFRKEYILDYNNDLVIGLSNHNEIKLAGFKLLHADRKIQEGKRELTVPEYLLKHALLRPIDGYTNDPKSPTLILNANVMKTSYIFNRWMGFKKEIVEALPLDNPEKKCAKILNHIRTYSVNNNQIQFDLTMDFMAHMVQKPWEKPAWSILYIGRQGCGKDVIPRSLGKMMHRNHWEEINDNELKNQRETGWRKGKLLVNVTELMKIREKDIAHVFQMIEAPEARIREMYMNTYPSKDICRFFFTTNKNIPFQATLDMRRFMAPDFNDEMGKNHDDSQAMILEKSNYWNEVYAEVGGREVDNITEGIIAFYQVLSQRNISKFDPARFDIETSTLDTIIESNENCLDVMINDIIFRGEIPDYNEMAIMPPIKFSIDESNIIEGDMINNNYKVLFYKTQKEGGVCYPPPGHISGHLVRGLGLLWEGNEFKNRRQHYKIMKNNKLHYVLPPLTELRNIYFKKHPNKRPTP